MVVSGLTKVYTGRGRRIVRAVGLVGASGSGKGTLAKMITASERPTNGSIRFGDIAAERLRGRRLRAFHGRVQMVFQDPYGALNPLHTVEYTVSRPGQNFLGLSGRQAAARVHELLETVGLTPAGPVRREATAPTVRRAAPACRHRPRAGVRP